MDYLIYFDFLEFLEHFLLSIWVAGLATLSRNNSVDLRLG